jgi:hypothetical protein
MSLNCKDDVKTFIAEKASPLEEKCNQTSIFQTFPIGKFFLFFYYFAIYFS